MANRITDKHLDALCERLNELTLSPLQPWVADETGRMRAQVGNFHISHAYGGVCLHRMSNENGGVSSVLTYGHIPRRELFEKMHIYILGFEAGRETERRAA